MFIFDYLVKSSLLMLLFLGLGILLRNYAATVRYSLWRLAFVLLALLPLAVLLMPVTNVPLLPAAQELTQDAEASRIYRPPASVPSTSKADMCAPFSRATGKVSTSFALPLPFTCNMKTCS